MGKWICLLQLLLLAAVYGDLREDELLDNAASTSAYVYDCVNAISGSYVDSEVDLVIPAPQPFGFRRSYSSANKTEGPLGLGWGHNFPYRLNNVDLGAAYRSVEIEQPGGSGLPMVSGFYEKGTMNFYVNRDLCFYGLTNTGGGEISGKTNHKNITLKLTPTQNSKDGLFSLTLGDGTKKFYADDKKIDYEILPNGNRLEYQYSNERKLIKVVLKNGSGSVTFGSFTIKDRDYYYSVTSNTGQVARYNKTKDPVIDKWIQKNAIVSGKIPTSFSIRDESNYIVCRNEKPAGRFLDVVYEKKKKKVVKEFVHSLRAPLGSNGKPVTLYSFDFNRDDRISTVRDAYKNRTEYRYNSNDWLTSVTRYNGKKIYSTEVMEWSPTYWSKGGSPLRISKTPGFLIGKVLQDENNQNVVLHTYDYDDFGNVVKESVYGNLTGNGLSRFKSKEDPGVESVFSTYTYSNDGFNLKLSEAPQDGLEQHYSYLPNTNLLARKIARDSNRIWSREFYSYDDCGFLVESITDDGSGESLEDLADVQVRKRLTKEIGRNPAEFSFCLPVQAKEEVFDRTSGKYLLIRRVVFEYGDNQRVIRESVYDANDQFAYEINRSFDSLGNVIFESDANGVGINRAFDENRNMIYEKRDGTPFESHFTYDLMNRCVAQTKKFDDGSERVVSFTYDYFGRMLSETDAYGNTTEYTYDAFGRNISKIYPQVKLDSGEILRPTEFKEYDLQGNVSAEIDAAGNRTEISYNLRKQPVKIIYPDGSLERNTYSVSGKLLESYKKNGSVIHYKYDPQGRVIQESIFTANGEILSVKTRKYSGSLLAEQTDSRGVVTRYEYNSAGQLIREIKGSSVTTIEYDSLGRESHVTRWIDVDHKSSKAIVQVTVRDCLNQVIEQRTEDLKGAIFARELYEYDVNGKEIKSVHAIGNGIESIASKEYNEQGDPISYIDPQGNTYTIYYLNDYINDLGQKVKCTGKIDPLGYCDQEEFSVLNRPAVHRRIDPNGNVLSVINFEYDIQGNQTARIESVFTPMGVRKYIVKYSYDLMGRKISEIEQPQSAISKVTSFEYDEAGRLVCIVKPDGVKIEHIYDELDRVITMRSSDGSVNYRYSYDGELVCQVDDLVSNSSVIRRYDDAENMTQEMIGSANTLFKYDSLNRLVEIICPDQGKIRYKYQGAHLESVTRLDKSNKELYSHLYQNYDLLNRSHRRVLPFGLGDNLQKWDLIGRKIGTLHSLYAHDIDKTDSLGKVVQSSVRDPKGVSACNFAYDDYYQLTSESGGINHTYEYDSLRNRVVKDGKYQKVNEINQLLDDQECRYSYDPCGNMISMTRGKSTANLKYDAFGRLVEYLCDGKCVRFTYDSFHRIIKKESTELKSDQLYFYIGDHELGALNQKMELINFRAYSPLESQAVGIEVDGSIYVPLYDCNGNLTTLVSKGGKVVESIRYSAFGEREDSKKEKISPYGFADKRFHSEMDLVSIGRRFYHPSTGRWITPDPIGFTDSANLYMYTHNNPYYFKDPSGLFSFKSFFKLCLKILGFYEALHTGVVSDQVTMVHMQLDGSCREEYVGPNGNGESGKIGFVNGINTSKDEWQKTAEHLSNIGGGSTIGGVYSESHSIFDIIEADFLFWLVDLKSVTELRKELIDFHENAAPDKKYLLFAHSRGTIVAYVALQGLPPEVRERVIVRAYAPAKYIPDNLGYSVINYRTNKDFVPWFQKIFSFPNDDHYTIQVIKSDAWLFDHSFNSQSFQPYIEKNIKKFQDGIWEG
jgi:RHS repeat-associated protein